MKLYHRIENLVGKEENAGQRFLFFPQYFQKDFFSASGFCPEIKSTGRNGPLSSKKVGHFRKYGAHYDANGLSAFRQVEKT